MAYVEEQLVKHGIRPKYVPPEPELSELVEADFDGEIRLRVGLLIEQIVSQEAIVTRVTDALRERLQLQDAAEFIREKFKERPTLRWKDVVDSEHSRRFWDVREEVEKKVREEIVTRVTGDLEEGEE